MSEPSSVKCPKCGEVVTPEYFVCPQCGFDVREWKAREYLRGDTGSRLTFLLLGTALTLVGAVVYALGVSSPLVIPLAALALGLLGFSPLALPQYRWRPPWKAIWSSWPAFLLWTTCTTVGTFLVFYFLLAPGNLSTAVPPASAVGISIFIWWALSSHGHNHLPLP